MYPDAPNPEDRAHLAGEAMHHLASEWIGPARDLVALHYQEMAKTGMDPQAAAHLTIQAQAFLLDYLHHVLVDVMDDDEEAPNEEDAEGIPTLTVDQDTADALKDVLRERGIDLGDQL